MKILSKQQIRDADVYTISHEPIASIDLMERASLACVDEILEYVPNAREFCILCGSGNNGGDGLAIARILAKRHFSVTVYNIQTGATKSQDNCVNLERLYNTLSPTLSLTIVEVQTSSELIIHQDAVILDALFGSGLHSPIDGLAKECITKINTSTAKKIAIDIPSGLYCDKPQLPNDCIFKAHFTITFQYPKLSFLFAENEQFVGDWAIVPIGLSKEFEATVNSPYNFTLHKDVALQQFSRFAHKGTKGHALLIAGSIGKTGAAVLASKACILSGCGLVTACIPQSANVILQTAVPEVMTIPNSTADFISAIAETDSFSAIGIGPGLGTHQSTQTAVLHAITHCNQAMVIDADALNILSENKEYLTQLPYETILTPHPGEFDRLTHKHTSSFERMYTQIEFSKQTGCIVVLKGKYTSISTPNGTIWFNSTGNHGMATAGSGDVLTGIITSLLAQSYTPLQAAQIGVYIHGLAGDIALQNNTTETIIASTIIEFLNKAFMNV
ncbi:MAG TPA: NAD(P)H-hydrate dehydratase [Bacteroidales bacterium]|nr:NAD(P)H-hydrate dehydratase [Bacteroidales bacterium]